MGAVDTATETGGKRPPTERQIRDESTAAPGDQHVTAYADRLATARRGLHALHQISPTPPSHLVDQLEAAHAQAFDTIRRIGAVEQQDQMKPPAALTSST